MAYREIGETGVRVSIFSLGTGSCSEDVLKAGLGLGVNLIHTSTNYSMGQSIEKVANVIKGKTGLVHIALKDNFNSIEDALEKLGVKQVDFLMWNRHNAEAFRQEVPEIKKQFLEWRDRGLVKYAGLTTHKQVAECLDVALEAGFFSCVMPSYGPELLKQLKKQREALRKKKISVIAMKTRGELGDDEYVEQIATVLTDPVTATVNKGVQTIEELKSWCTASARVKTGFLNRRWHENYAQARDYQGCALCGKCEEACSHGVAAADIVRCIRYYHDAEKMPEVAAQEFRDLNCAASIGNCRQCGECEKACPQHIPVRKEILRAGNRWLNQTGRA
jgi:predicted aldo/keto reductase-like oxidoreductase